MNGLVLHYVYDPLCGWCYAAGPLVDAVAEAGHDVVLHGGGLWSTPTRIAPDKRAMIRQADARIADLANVPFGKAYLDRLLADPDTVLWSRPTTAAVLAAVTIRRAGDLAMLHAIQHAHYVDGLHVVDPGVLARLAGSLGAGGDFRASLKTVPVDGHIAASRQLMQRTGLQGFPGFLIEREGGFVRLAHERFYGRPADFLSFVETSAQQRPHSPGEPSRTIGAKSVGGSGE